ncbi:MAG: hypothetical protein IJA94_06470 [Bacilli bacterium]|nr:hypothetical protein [Bacilli bacterium]
MNKEYLEEFYEENKNALKDSEQEIKGFMDFVEYIKDTITSNIQYDFNLDIDVNKLLEIDEMENII